MKKAFLLVIFLIVTLSFGATPTTAVCREIASTGQCDAGQFRRDYELTIAGTAQCISGTNGSKSVCCDEQSEANAVDSVRAPLCGSSQELGKANSSCWTCGADIRCAGLDLGLESADTTADIINNKQAVGANDTPEQVERLWRVPNDKIPDTFRFNGIEYNRDGKGLIICRSNVLGCGASEVACESTLYPGEDIRDESTDDPDAGSPQDDEPYSHMGRIDDADYFVEDIPGINPGDPITIASRTVNFLSGLGLFNSWLANLIIRIYYTNDQHAFDDMRPMALRLYNSYSKPLLAYDLQERFRPPFFGPKAEDPRQRLPWDSGYRLCIQDGQIRRSDGSIEDNIPLEGLARSRAWIGEGDPVDERFYDKLTTALSGLVAFFTPATIPGLDFFYQGRGDLVQIQRTERLPDGRTLYIVDEEDLDRALPLCEAQAVGIPTSQTETIAAGEARRGASGGFFGRFFNWIGLNVPALADRGRACDPDDTNQSCADVNVTLRPGDAAAAAPNNDCMAGGCTLADLSPRAPADARYNLVTNSGGDIETNRRGGLFNAFWPDQLPDFIKVHARVPQIETLGGSRADTGTRGSYPLRTAGVQDTYNCIVKKMLMPSDLQDPRDRCLTLEEGDPVSAQHGRAEVPLGISSIIDGIRPRPEGILGAEFLEQYSETLITTALTPSQRALLMARIQELIDRYVANGAWPGSELGNTVFQDQIRQFAQDNGINEAFLYALWIEETHASSVGDYPFGCNGWTREEFTESLNCVANDPTVRTYIRGDLDRALCMYADGHYPCDFTAHPNFVRNLMYYYDFLTTPEQLTP